jgi:DNA-binding MarR family transcriptional regulator
MHHAAAKREHVWRFMTNHAVVLLLIAENPSIRIGELSESVGISTRATQMIVADLCRAGYVERTRIGRCNRYSLDRSQPMRHAAIRDRGTVAALLAMFEPADPSIE